MRTLNVVCVNFQFGLGVDLCPTGQQQVFVAHVCVGFLSILMDVYPAIKHNMRLVGCNIPVGLPAVAVRSYVFNGNVVVIMLPVLGHDNTIKLALSTITFKTNHQIMPAQWATKTNSMAFEPGAALLANTGSTDVLNIVTFHIQVDAGYAGAVRQIEFYNGINHSRARTVRDELFYQCDLTMMTGIDKDAGIG